jgi:hypothetical protein
VSFHQQTQRFAVGTVESSILVYDLRTATKWRVLEGTEGPVSALAFERTGERLCSFAAQERALRVWKSGSQGLIGGILGIRGKCAARIPVDLGALGSSEGRWRLDWPAEAVVLKREGMEGPGVVMPIPAYA